MLTAGPLATLWIAAKLVGRRRKKENGGGLVGLGRDSQWRRRGEGW